MMKFLNKINRNYFLLFTIILIGISIAGYFIIQAIFLNETKENLLRKEYLINKQILETGEIPNLYPIIEVKKTDSLTIEKPFFNEILIKDELEDESELFLEYSNQIRIKDSFYSIKLRQSLFESKDLVIILAQTLFILLLSAFGILFFITKKMNKTIWADFEHNLHEIENFTFNENNNLNLLKSDIEEFDRLNKAINNLTEKLKADWLSLKKFTENASHEIQTPLSIALLNLEEVLQQKLNAETFKKVVSSMDAVKRLSTLNQSLILLTKIENRQFIADKVLSINDIVKRKIQEFESLFETKNLKVELNIEQDFALKMNEQLAEILINNLLSNAINHNLKGGYIRISVREKELKICNTGEANLLTDETIFNRFTKGNSKSYGLGLAVVKNICDTHNLEIHYLKNELHCFIINSKF
jgi:signal transduction histidine kinase